MKKTLIFRLTEEDRQRLHEIARAEDRTITAIIRRALAPILTPAEENNSPPRRKKPEDIHTLAD